jgi:hypothetical protein
MTNVKAQMTNEAQSSDAKTFFRQDRQDKQDKKKLAVKKMRERNAKKSGN